MSRPSSVVPSFQYFARGEAFGERLVIAVDVLGVGQLARLARNAAEELQRRGNGVGRRHVVDQFGGDARILQILLDEFGVLFVELLRLRGGRRGGRAALPFLACALHWRVGGPYIRAMARSALPAMAKRNFIIAILPRDSKLISRCGGNVKSAARGGPPPKR